MKNRLLVAFATLAMGFAVPAFAQPGNNGGGNGGCGVGQTTNGCGGVINAPGLGNQLLNNLELSAGAGVAVGAGGSITAGATFSKGFVSTGNGLNNDNIASAGITQVNASAVGEGSIQGNLGGSVSGAVKGVGLTNSTSYSGAMVNGTGTAWNVTGGGAIAIGGGLAGGGVVSTGTTGNAP